MLVHGLGGNWQSTWANKDDPDALYWPERINEHFGDINTWALDYNTKISGWVGNRMSITEHADSVLELFASSELGDRPIIFITHSLGGILVKSVLRASCETIDRRKRQVGTSTRGIIFFGTPNSGSSVASTGLRLLACLGPLGGTIRVAPIVQELRAHSPALRNLNRWYRDAVSNGSYGLNVATKIYYEKRGIYKNLLMIVDETSADPGIANVIPIPVDADHISLCKIVASDRGLYNGVRQFIDSCVTQPISIDLTPSDHVTRELNRVRSWQQCGLVSQSQAEALTQRILDEYYENGIGSILRTGNQALSRASIAERKGAGSEQ